MVTMVPMKLVEIIPVFGLSVSLGSNNDLAFTAKLSQSLSKALNIYKLETPLYVSSWER